MKISPVEIAFNYLMAAIIIGSIIAIPVSRHLEFQENINQYIEDYGEHPYAHLK